MELVLHIPSKFQTSEQKMTWEQRKGNFWNIFFNTTRIFTGEVCLCIWMTHRKEAAENYKGMRPPPGKQKRRQGKRKNIHSKICFLGRQRALEMSTLKHFFRFFTWFFFTEVFYVVIPVLKHSNRAILECASYSSNIRIIYGSICFSFGLVMWSCLLASQLTLNCHILCLKN